MLGRAAGLAPAAVDTRLRERSFGTLELQATSNYERVWAVDATGQAPTEFEAEGTESVRARLCQLLRETEEAHAGRCVVLSSHGDTLQILQTIFAGIPPHQHRSLPHLENAELRRMQAGAGPLPQGD